MNSQTIINQARQANRKLLTEVESKTLLSGIGIPVTETRLAKTPEEAAAFSKNMGFPVALKIVSSDISHKSDAGGVKLKLNSEQDVRKAYDEIMASVKTKFPAAVIEGISVQQMAKPGLEIIVGMSKDTQFGPVLMFGLGGIFVEILKDVSFRIAPLQKEDAVSMIREIKSFALLQGFRGSDKVDIAALENILLKLSDFVISNPEIKELDLNPIFAYKDGVVAVDARVVLE
jgi:acyl-CoA synthetase (NDP forming)